MTKLTKKDVEKKIKKKLPPKKITGFSFELDYDGEYCLKVKGKDNANWMDEWHYYTSKTKALKDLALIAKLI